MGGSIAFTQGNFIFFSGKRQIILKNSDVCGNHVNLCDRIFSFY